MNNPIKTIAKVFSFLSRRPGQQFTTEEIISACNLKSSFGIVALYNKGFINGNGATWTFEG